MFWVPQSGDIGIGVSILSYNDNVQFSLITDRHFVADPETIAMLFAAEFDKMMLALLMLDWEQPFDPAQVEQQLFGTQMPPPLVPEKAGARKPAAKHAAAVRTKRQTAGKAETPAAIAAARVPKRFRNPA
jgi:hypothetical protein